MLSRIANSLLWMGRYLERAQHTSRYINVHYFSSLDAPVLSRKEFVLHSICDMTSLEADFSADFDDHDIIFKIMMDEHNPVSIKSCIVNARENARGARDVLSSELWESINKFYHSVNSFPTKNLSEEKILDFTQMVCSQTAIVNSYIENSLLHNDTWSLIRLGTHIEAAGQISRIIISKMTDIKKAGKEKLGKAVENFQSVTLLKSTEAYDMSRIHYKTMPSLTHTLEFLILNREFPRSIIYNLEEVDAGLRKIKIGAMEQKESPDFFSGKLISSFKFLTIEEIEPDILPFMEKTLTDIYYLGSLVEKKIALIK
ncbi:MAG: alpha-E domain-containing protein [Cytophagaceae bacterium]